MATQKEIQLCGEIMMLAVRVNMGKKYHAFCDLAGHVDWIEVRLFPKGNTRQHVAGWGDDDERRIKLSTNHWRASYDGMPAVVESVIGLLERTRDDLAALLREEGK